MGKSKGKKVRFGQRGGRATAGERDGSWGKEVLGGRGKRGGQHCSASRHSSAPALACASVPVRARIWAWAVVSGACSPLTARPGGACARSSLVWAPARPVTGWGALEQDAPRKEEAEDDDDEEEEVTAGIAAVSVGGSGTAPAPFSFKPAPKGQSPFGTGGGAAPMFSFPAGGADGAAAEPNFSFNFAATQGNKEKKDGAEGDGEDEGDEDEEDPVEEFIKSLPEPVQKCVGALDSLDEEVCELEAQFRKEMRDLERKVIVFRGAFRLCLPGYLSV